jgi:hypothetical protein
MYFRKIGFAIVLALLTVIATVSLSELSQAFSRSLLPQARVVAQASPPPQQSLEISPLEDSEADAEGDTQAELSISLSSQA